MARMQFQGREMEVVPVEYRIEREDWNEYQLFDGSHLRLKVVVSEIVRVVGEYDLEGNPVYIAKSGNILAVRSPDELKRMP